MSATTTTTTEQPKAYQPPVEGTTFHGDGREQALLTSLQSHSTSLANNPQAVLDAIDAFGRARYLMNVGGPKGHIVDSIIRAARPRLVLELGAYIGYSAIAFARHLPEMHKDAIESGGAVLPEKWETAGEDAQRVGYVSLELSPDYARVARGAVALAGLSPIVQIIEGPSTDSIRALRSTLRLPKNTTFDLVFLDHYKPLYTTDLKLLESLELIGPGTTLVADNVLKPGNPPYLAYVRASPTQKARAIEAGRGVLALYPELAENEETGGVKRNMANGYEGQEQAVEEREGERGRPEWVYESRLVRSWDPYTAEEDGIEVSRLVG